MRVERVQAPAGPELAARAPDDDHVLHEQRRDGTALPGPHVTGSRVPHLLAGRRVERDDVGVEGGHVDLAVPHGHAAVDVPAAQRDVVRGGVLVPPELFAGLGVEGPALAVRAGDVHDPLHHDRGGLVRVGRGAGLHAHRAGLEHPGGGQALDVLLGDLVELAVALTVVGAVVGEPVLRFRAGVDDALVVHVPGGRRASLDRAELHVGNGLACVDVVGHLVVLPTGAAARDGRAWRGPGRPRRRRSPR